MAHENLGPHRSEEQLSDLSTEHLAQRTPSEESAIQIAETMSRADIQNQIAQMTADVEIRRATIKQAQEELEAVEFGLGVFKSAAQLAQDMNPGI